MPKKLQWSKITERTYMSNQGNPIDPDHFIQKMEDGNWWLKDKDGPWKKFPTLKAAQEYVEVELRDHVKRILKNGIGRANADS